MSFGQKVGLFRKICNEEKIDQSSIDEICKNIGFVQETRNKIAHNELIIENFAKSIIRLQPRKRSINADDMIEITDELVKEVGDKTLLAIQGIVDMFKKIENKPKEVSVDKPTF